jgi:MFS family permease
MTSEASAATRHGTTVSRWELVALLWLAFFFNQADRQIFGVTLPLIRTEFGLTSTQMGLIATTFTVVFGLLVPVAGLAGDIFRRHYIVVCSLLTFSIGTLLTGTASGFVMLLIYRGLATGVGEALYAPAANSLIAEHHVASRSRALATHQTANYTGVVVGSLFAGWVADNHGWRAAFYLFGACGLAWSMIIALRTRHYPSAVHTPRSAGLEMRLVRESVREIIHSPQLLAQVVGFSGLVFVLVGYLTWMPSILAEKFQLSLASAGFQSVVWHHVLGYLGLLLTGVASDRLAPRYPSSRLLAMGLALTLCAPWIYLSATLASTFGVYCALGAFGFFRGVYDANLFAAIFDCVENRLRSTITGLVVACAYTAGAVAPVMMGILADHYGTQAGLQALAMVALIAGMVFLGIILSASRPFTPIAERR